jgi:hypothetical protein
MAGGGIFALPLGGWARVRFAAGMAIVVQSCFTLAKIMRDRHEANRMINRIEAAASRSCRAPTKPKTPR